MDNKRKHYTQMDSAEVTHVMQAVRRNRYSLGSHAIDRMRGRKITEAQINAMMSYCSVIEAHNNVASEVRVLVRGKVQGQFCCAVVSLTTKKVVTCYWNQAGDHHKTLDLTAYKWDVNLKAIL